MPKPRNPYNDLLERAREFISKIYNRRVVPMWTYPKARLGERWQITDLYERAAAAEQLGYDVILKATDAGLEVKYRQQLPAREFEFTYQ